jgi:Uma2 family endonuclease
MVHNPPHDATVDLVHELLRDLLPAGWRIRIQSAITTSDSEPEPDLAIVRGQAATYVNRHPGPSDIGLVIEVADSSLDHDRGLKRGIYARACVARYWIVNLVERTLEVHEDPTGPAPVPGYRGSRVYALSESVALVLAEREVGRIAVSSLFPTQETSREHVEG